MSVTLEQFRVRFPQFDSVGDNQANAKLAEAVRRVGAAWGDLQDDGTYYLTAHLLASDPLCEPSAKAPSTAGSENWSKTTYLVEFERLREEARSGFFGTVGRPGTDMDE